MPIISSGRGNSRAEGNGGSPPPGRRPATTEVVAGKPRHLGWPNATVGERSPLSRMDLCLLPLDSPVASTVAGIAEVMRAVFSEDGAIPGVGPSAHLRAPIKLPRCVAVGKVPCCESEHCRAVRADWGAQCRPFKPTA
jgi:hypothetical protein